MKVKNAMLAIAAAMIALTATSASAFEFHGYFRSGLGVNTKGGGMVCFANPGSWYKFRLGNECETYGELIFNQTLYTGKDGAEFKYEGMLGMATTQVADFENLASPQNHIALRENFVTAKLPQLGGATLWGGKRYYKRHDVHMIDFFYWNSSNPGAGIEDVDAGFAKLAFAVLANGNQPKSNTLTADLRAYGIPLYPNASLEVGVLLGFVSDQACGTGETTGCKPAGSKRQQVSPLFVVEHTQSNLMGGSNKLAVQWGSGSQANADGSGNFGGGTSNDSQFRIVENLQIQPVPEFSGQLAATYQDIKKEGGGGGKGWGAGIRPVYHVNDYFKVQGEFGYNSWTVKAVGTTAKVDTNMFKATIAPTVVAGGNYYSRPELRLFVTYATWNDAARDAGVASRAFGTATNGTTIGAQVEAWW